MGGLGSQWGVRPLPVPKRTRATGEGPPPNWKLPPQRGELGQDTPTSPQKRPEQNQTFELPLRSADLVGEARWWEVTHLSTSGQSPASQCNLLGSSLLFSGSFFAAKAENPSCAVVCSYRSWSTALFTPGDEWPQHTFSSLPAAPAWSTHRAVTCCAVRRSRAAPVPSMGFPRCFHTLWDALSYIQDQESQSSPGQGAWSQIDLSC